MNTVRVVSLICSAILFTIATLDPIACVFTCTTVIGLEIKKKQYVKVPLKQAVISVIDKSLSNSGSLAESGFWGHVPTNLQIGACLSPK